MFFLINISDIFAVYFVKKIYINQLFRRKKHPLMKKYDYFLSNRHPEPAIIGHRISAGKLVV